MIKKINEYASPYGWAMANKRKVEMLQLRADGLSSEQIANKMGIEIGTLKNNVSKTCKALECNNVTHAVAVAFRLKIIK